MERLLPKFFGEPVRIFVTSCVMHEIRNLGPELEPAWRACRRHALHHCGHDDRNRVSAADCLAAQVGERERFGMGVA